MRSILRTDAEPLEGVERDVVVPDVVELEDPGLDRDRAGQGLRRDRLRRVVAAKKAESEHNGEECAERTSHPAENIRLLVILPA